MFHLNIIETEDEEDHSGNKDVLNDIIFGNLIEDLVEITVVNLKFFEIVINIFTCFKSVIHITGKNEIAHNNNRSSIKECIYFYWNLSLIFFEISNKEKKKED